jgi:hypothetical protein
MRRVFAFFLIFSFLFTFLRFAPSLYAQDTSSSGVAVYIQIIDKKVQEGDIITLTKDGYVLGHVPYDPNIFGVVVRDPAISFEANQPNSRPVVSEGKVFMRVSTINGKIKKGDLLTTSTIPGVGEKATESGFIIGTALEDYSSNNPGMILVVLNVGQGAVSAEARGNLLKAFNFVFSAPYISPLSLLRYIFASTMVILSFVIGIGYFGRISSLGIQALGRNPLASRLIIFSIVIHVFLALVVFGIGIGIAYLVLMI